MKTNERRRGIIYIFMLIVLNAQSGESTTVNSPPFIVKQPPTDELLFQVASSVEESDKPFIIECEADSYPEAQYRWIKNGKEFNWQVYDKRISQQPGRGTLLVSKPRNEDQGQYQCFAYNSLGTATSNSVFLRKAELNAFKDENPETVLAEEGKPFSLPCAAPDGFPKPRVDWLLQNTKGSITNINSSRITVDPEGKLWFSNVTKFDKSTEYLYACSAYSPFKNEYKLGNRVFLSVSPTSSSASQNKFQPTIQYTSKRKTVAIRGQKLELWCIIGGTPLPEIVWSKKNGGLPSDRTEYDNYGKTLRISSVEFSDEGTYECNGSNGVGQPLSYSVEVKVESAPYFTVEPEIMTAAEGETVEFRCEAHGVSAPVLKWIFNGKPLEEAEPNPRRTQEVNRIVIRDILKSDTGNYGCNATNSLGYVYKDVYVNVLSLPPEIRTVPKDTVVTEGKGAVLACRTFGAPNPIVRWIRNEQELTGGRFKVLANGDLDIKTVGFADAGTYQCLATNKFGAANASAKLVVKSPTIIKEGPENFQVAAGNPAKFICTAVADDTLDLEIEWLNEGAPIDFDSNPRYIKLQDNSLTIDKTTELDSGLYTCLAKTEFDSVTASANLIVQDVPNRPELISVDCHSRDATIRWKAMGDGRAPILHYVIQFNTTFTPSSWEVASREVPATESSYTVSMSPWANYTFRVVAKNSIGYSLPSVHSDRCETSEDVPYKNPEGVRGDKAEAGTLRITWTPMPEIEHNGRKFRYEVQWKEDDAQHGWNTEIVNDWRKNEWVVSGQPIYRPYLLRVRALNEKGQSNVAPTIVQGFSGQAPPTQAPNNFTLITLIDPKSALVAWEEVSPESIQGKFEGYKIEAWTDGDGEGDFRTITTHHDVTQAVVNTLLPYSRNYLRVYAFNSDHSGPPSRILEIQTEEGTPGAVEDLQVLPLGVSSLLLRWSKPGQPNGILLGYSIKYVKVEGTEVKWDEQKERLPNITHPDILSAKLGGLESGTKYRVYVYAETSAGPGEDSYGEERTYDENATVLAKPGFRWDHEKSPNDLSAVRVNWNPNFEGAGRPGSHFYVQYKESGRSNWVNRPEVLNEDFDIVRGLSPGETYVFRVVAVDGLKSMPSDEEEIYTYAPNGPIIRAESSFAPGWLIGLLLALLLLLLLLLLVCLIKRNRGGKYAVYEREVAHGHLDYEDGFREYSAPGSGGGGERASMVSDFKLPPPESDTDSLAEYEAEAKFTEDGSFIGQYGVKKKADANIPSPLATFV